MVAVLGRLMDIEITDHAYWRAAERFPKFDTLNIEGEVRRALQAGRVSRAFRDLNRGDTLYAWTPGESRIYALRAEEDCFVVVTVMRPVEPDGYRIGDGGRTIPTSR